MISPTGAGIIEKITSRPVRVNANYLMLLMPTQTGRFVDAVFRSTSFWGYSVLGTSNKHERQYRIPIRSIC